MWLTWRLHYQRCCQNIWAIEVESSDYAHREQYLIGPQVLIEGHSTYEGSKPAIPIEHQNVGGTMVVKNTDKKSGLTTKELTEVDDLTHDHFFFLIDKDITTISQGLTTVWLRTDQLSPRISTNCALKWSVIIRKPSVTWVVYLLYPALKWLLLKHMSVSFCTCIWYTLSVCSEVYKQLTILPQWYMRLRHIDR